MGIDYVQIERLSRECAELTERIAELQEWLKIHDMRGLECAQTVEHERALVALAQKQFDLLQAVPALVERAHRCDVLEAEEMRDRVQLEEILAFYEHDKAAEEAGLPRKRNICGHCLEEHPLDENGSMRAHLVQCPKNWMANRLVELTKALGELLDFADGTAAASDVPVFFKNEAVNVGRLRQLLQDP